MPHCALLELATVPAFAVVVVSFYCIATCVHFNVAFAQFSMELRSYFSSLLAIAALLQIIVFESISICLAL